MQTIRSFFCRVFGFGCVPSTTTPSRPSRLVNVDILGPTDFTATLLPDLFPAIQGQRRIPEAPWHITFDVPEHVTGGAWIEVNTDHDAESWLPSRTRLSDNGSDMQIPFTDTQLPSITVELAPRNTVTRRTGTPIIQNRVFSDASGPYLALGTSLFWAVWGIMHDRAKLEANLDYLKGRVDFIRVFCTVGGGLWDQRAAPMQEVIDTDALRQLANLAYDTYGIRIMPTVFASKSGTPDERRAFVQYVGNVVRSMPEKFQLTEVVNEAENSAVAFDRNEVIEHAAALQKLVPHNVALTAPFSDWAAYYQNTPADIMTLHLERDVNGTGGVWRPVRQAREGQAMSTPWVSNEPIGIASSVAQDDDPLRLTMSAGCVWLCQGAAYILHTGAGIYGLAYQGSTGYRQANLWEQGTMSAVLDGLSALRKLLPADLPNWKFVNNNRNFPDYPFDTDPLVQEDAVLRSFAALNGNRFVCLPIRVAKDTPYIAKRRMTFTHYDPLTGNVIASPTLNPGERYILPGSPDGQRAAVFIGILE